LPDALGFIVCEIGEFDPRSRFFICHRVNGDQSSVKELFRLAIFSSICSASGLNFYNKTKFGSFADVGQLLPEGIRFLF
jgi:hypothetical protein